MLTPKNPILKVAVARLISKHRNLPVREVLAGLYGSGDRLLDLSEHLTKTATEAGSTTGWGSNLIQTALADFIADLVPVSAYAALGTYGTQLSFDGQGEIPIPFRNRTIDANNNVGASFVGEGGAIPVKRLTLGSHILKPYRVSVISPFSNESLERTNVESIVRNEILKDSGVALDGGLLDANAAVVGVRPAGLLNGVTPTASAGDLAADIITDLKVLLSGIAAVGHKVEPVLILHPNRVVGLATATTPDGGLLFPFLSEAQGPQTPIISTSNIDEALVMMVDASSFVAANDVPTITVGAEASLVMASADAQAPTMATDGAGGFGTEDEILPGSGISISGGEDGVATANAEAISLFQTDAAALRMVMKTSWGLLHPNSVSAISGASW